MQHLGQDRRPLLVEHALGQCGDQSRARIPAHHHDAAAVGAQARAVLDGVVKRRFHVIERRRTGVLWCQPVVDRHDQAACRAGQVHTVRMVGIEVSGHEAAAVGIQRQRRRRLGQAAVEPQAKPPVARTGDGAVFDLDAAGVDGRRALGSQPIGTLPLGRQ